MNELGKTDTLLYCHKHHEHYWAGTECRYCEEEDSMEPDEASKTDSGQPE